LSVCADDFAQQSALAPAIRLAAVAQLVAQQGATVAACLFLIELGFLGGRAKLPGVNVSSLITY